MTEQIEPPQEYTKRLDPKTRTRLTHATFDLLITAGRQSDNLHADATQYTRSQAGADVVLNRKVEGKTEEYKILKVNGMENEARIETIRQLHELLVENFSEAEVDGIEIFNEGTDPELRDSEGMPTEGVRVYVAKNENGEVVSGLVCGLIELRDDQGAPTGKDVLFVTYAVTKQNQDGNMRRTGLGRELYAQALVDCQNASRLKKHTLAFSAGEAVDSSEKFWNAVGWKRSYLTNESGAEEMKYMQPALEYDAETGNLADDAADCPEHFMIDHFRQHPPTKEELVQTLKSFYEWGIQRPRSDFNNDEAYANHLAHIDGVLQYAIESLKRDDPDSKLLFLTQKDRMRATGTAPIEDNPLPADKVLKVIDYEVDSPETGEEDL